MAIENNEFTIGLFQDLFKAFDTVNHNILLQKLDFYGIRGLCNHCFRDYLAERQQIVKKQINKMWSATMLCTRTAAVLFYLPMTLICIFLARILKNLKAL